MEISRQQGRVRWEKCCWRFHSIRSAMRRWLTEFNTKRSNMKMYTIFYGRFVMNLFKSLTLPAEKWELWCRGCRKISKLSKFVTNERFIIVRFWIGCLQKRKKSVKIQHVFENFHKCFEKWINYNKAFPRIFFNQKLKKLHQSRRQFSAKTAVKD